MNPQNQDVRPKTKDSGLVARILNHIKGDCPAPEGTDPTTLLYLKSGDTSAWRQFLQEIKDDDMRSFARDFAERKFSDLKPVMVSPLDLDIPEHLIRA